MALLSSLVPGLCVPVSYGMKSISSTPFSGRGFGVLLASLTQPESETEPVFTLTTPARRPKPVLLPNKPFIQLLGEGTKLPQRDNTENPSKFSWQEHEEWSQQL